jgi:membrane-bound lytic murein transglycosylase D
VKSIRSFLAPFLLIAASFLILTGCASITSQRSGLADQQQSSMIVTAEVLQDDVPRNDSDKYTLTNEQKISQAEYLCAFERYSEADSILRVILNELQSSSDGKPNEYLKNSDLFSSIFGIYKDLIPAEYLSEDISKLIEKYNLMTSIDSMVVTDGDSILPTILQAISSATFDVPVVFNERVQKACFFYLLNNRKTVENWVRRSSLYLPIIRKMFSDSSLPLDLAYLPLIESGFNVMAYSHAQAAGIWQFIPSTGKHYGLRNSYWVDERRDPLKATSSAISYLKKLFNDFGNWHLALAAYNCGEGGVSRAIKKAGVSDYWQLQLPKETMNYVPLFIASVIIVKNLEHFGFNTIDSAAALRPEIVTINDCIDLAEIARGIQVNKDSLRLMNPHILHWCTPPDISRTRLYIPDGKADTFVTFLSSIPDDKKVKWYRYRVGNGDNLLSIGKKFKVSVEAIRSVNRLNNNRIVAGKYLFIPIPVHGATSLVMDKTKNEKRISSDQNKKPSGTPVQYRVKKGDTIWGIADLFDADVNQIYSWNNLSTENIIKENDIIEIYQSPKTINGTATVSKSSLQYQVAKGDNLFRIAENFEVSVAELKLLNSITSSSVIKVGDLLQIPENNGTKALKEQSSEQSVVYYEVKRGDNLWRIAGTFGIPVQKLCSINNLSADSVIMPGDVIKVMKAKDL